MMEGLEKGQELELQAADWREMQEGSEVERPPGSILEADPVAAPDELIV